MVSKTLFLCLLCTYRITTFVSCRFIKRELNDFDLFTNISKLTELEEQTSMRSVIPIMKIPKTEQIQWYDSNNSLDLFPNAKDTQKLWDDFRDKNYSNDFEESSRWSSWQIWRLFLYVLFVLNGGCVAYCRMSKRAARTERVSIIVAEQAAPREDPPRIATPVPREEPPPNSAAPPPSYDEVVTICPLPTYEEIMDKKENVSNQV